MTLQASVKAIPKALHVQIQGSVDPQPYLTGVVIFVTDPTGAILFADLQDVQPGANGFASSFVMPDNAPKGTYTMKVYWNPNNGPGVPQLVQSTFTV